ncbi:MAG: Periplasmic serine endoprotease DegP precursor [Bacteroidetes bacterium ADurb.Bin408]|nr:MAG: Periplasmic serine endoprotease DegP precursor [Bacteroidetes bacterium ADurb.Bin408]
MRVGEWVLAVGNPFNLNSTVTAGIVSAKARDINILGKADAIETFIQTDAAVNRGNSGGALVNTKGELIGINAAIASNTGSYTGYSFAIPVNIVKKVFKDLLEYGQVQRAYMGVEVTDMTSKLAAEKGIAKVPGVYVSNVIENSAASDAGLKKGDIIIEMESKSLSSASELLEIVAAKSPGETINIIYLRGSKQNEIVVKLKNKFNTYEIVKSDKESIVNILGASFENLTKEEASRLGIKYGVKVKNIGSGKLRSYGVREGFIITSIDKTPVSNTDELYNIIKNKKGGVLIEGVYPNGVRAYYGFGL